MFKGNLIEENSYYRHRRAQIVYILLPSIVMGFLVNFYQLPLWLTVLAIVVYIALLGLTIRNQKAISEITNHKIEIDSKEIRIKDTKGNLKETIVLKQLDYIKVKQEYKVAQESLSDLKEELKGNVDEFYIVVSSNKNERRIDFTINSHYMINQLTKIIEEWQRLNYKILSI